MIQILNKKLEEQACTEKKEIGQLHKNIENQTKTNNEEKVPIKFGLFINFFKKQIKFDKIMDDLSKVKKKNATYRSKALQKKQDIASVKKKIEEIQNLTKDTSKSKSGSHIRRLSSNDVSEFKF